MEYHYESGDIGAYEVKPTDDIRNLIESAFAREGIPEDPLVNIIFRRNTEID